MDRCPDSIATLNTSLSSVSVQDATTNPPTTPTKTPGIASPTSSATSFVPLSHPTLPSAAPQHVSSSMMEVDNNSAAENRSRRATSVLSMDDLEAAQALEGLRADFGPPPPKSTIASPESKSQPEPLLSLLTSTTHPLISSAISGSVSAYTSSKSYSPRFKSGAEFLERNIGSHVANTVNSVGRKTGVESGLRWALQRHATTSSEPNRSKRRKVSGDKHPTEVDLEKGADATMGTNQIPNPPDLYLNESLPPYDDEKSPNYTEISADSRARQATWQSRLMISTSGLGVAMSEESLRSLQYCLTWLKWANGRLGKAIVALQETLKEWDDLRQTNEDGTSTLDGAAASDRTQLSQRLQALKEDVLHTLKQVVDVVSKYAGGALPENARYLVRRHLTSLPHRFQVASTACSAAESSSDTSVSARRILVLAQEGLDMMSQVSGVVNDTLVSAEHWCERLGRKRPSSKNASEAQPQDQRNEQFPADIKLPVREPSRDAPMTGVEKA